MSTGTRMPLGVATDRAYYVLDHITGEATIVGSIRRKKPDVGDIEILVHRDAQVELPVQVGLYAGAFVTVKGGGRGWKYWQIEHLSDGWRCDLFRCDDDNRGSLMLIRTGPRDFSQRYVMALTKHAGLVHRDGYVRMPDSGTVVPCPTEHKAFSLAGMRYIEPEGR